MKEDRIAISHPILIINANQISHVEDESIIIIIAMVVNNSGANQNQWNDAIIADHHHHHLVNMKDAVIIIDINVHHHSDFHINLKDASTTTIHHAEDSVHSHHLDSQDNSKDTGIIIIHHSHHASHMDHSHHLADQNNLKEDIITIIIHHAEDSALAHLLEDQDHVKEDITIIHHAEDSVLAHHLEDLNHVKEDTSHAIHASYLDIIIKDLLAVLSLAILHANAYIMDLLVVEDIHHAHSEEGDVGDQNLKMMNLHQVNLLQVHHHHLQAQVLLQVHRLILLLVQALLLHFQVIHFER